jgi:hypothetical protein
MATSKAETGSSQTIKLGWDQAHRIEQRYGIFGSIRPIGQWLRRVDGTGLRSCSALPS